jgi:hypothetical protein
VARIRSIKPEFWKSQAIAQLDFFTRLVFIGLWTYVDDNGVGIDHFRLIAAELFPLEEDLASVARDVRESLASLEAAGRITRYAVDGKQYLAVTNWSEHQKIDRPNKPRYPSPGSPFATPTPPTSGNAPPRETLDEPSRESRATPPSGAVEQRNRGTEEKEHRRSATEAKVDIPRHDVDRVCEHLADRIEANGSKRPTVTAKWRIAARLLIDTDGRAVEQIIRCIDWCQNDPFWRSNVLSMPKLREKYDQLRLAAQREGPAVGRATVTTRHIDDLTPEERADRNPFAGAVRASQLAEEAS